MKSEKTRFAFVPAAIAIIFTVIIINAGCGEDPEEAVEDLSVSTTGGSGLNASIDTPTAAVRKYFDSYLSGDCANAIEMFSWDIPPSDSDLEQNMLQWKQAMLQGCSEKHAMLESYEVVAERIEGRSTMVITHLKGIENGLLLDENVPVPVEKVNGEWKLGLWMTWPFRPDSNADSTNPVEPAPIGPPPLTEP